MSTPPGTRARGLGGGAYRWAATLAQLGRYTPQALAAGTAERLAFSRLALRAGRDLSAGSRGPERADLLLLALVNVRAAVLCLTATQPTTSDSAPSDAAEPPSVAAEPPEPDLSAIASRTIEHDLNAEPEQVRRELELLLAYGERLLGELEEPARRARAARQRAWVKALAPLLVVAFVVGLGGWSLFRAREVSAGKPWTTSSVALVCDPAHKLCGGARTSILFHTLEDDQPWFEIDLGAAHALTRIEVHNRTDCCAERAVPLIVEVSLDHVHYQTVARKFATFDRWKQQFPTTQARYVRLRVARRSMLHLEQVQVFGRRLE